MEQHRKGVSAVDFSTDGSLVATGSYDLTVQVSDAATGKLRKKLVFKEDDGNFSSIEMIRFSPDAKLLAACCAREIKFWQVADWQLVGTISQADSGGFQCIAFAAPNRLVSQTNSELVQVWEVPSGRLNTKFKAGDYLDYFALSPDGKTLVADNEQHQLVLYDIASGVVLGQLPGHKEFVHHVAFSPDGNTLASFGSDKQLILWNWREGKQLRAVPTDNCSALEFSPDGSLLAVGWYDIGLLRIDVDPPERIAQLNVRGASACGQVRFSPTGRQVVATDQSHQRRADVWTLHWSREERTLVGSEDSVRTLAASPDGKWLASGDTKTINLWNADTGELVKKLEVASRPWGKHLDFSYDSKMLLYSGNSYGKGETRVWEIPSGKTLHTWDRGELPEYASFVPDRAAVLLSGYRLWDLETDKVTQVDRRFPFYPARFSRDGTLLLTAGYGLEIHHWPDGGVVRSWKPHANAPQFGLSSDNRLLSTGTWGDREAILWNLETGEVVHRFRADDEGVSAISISPDDKWIVTAGQDRWLRIWSVETGKLRAAVPAHRDRITNLLFFGPGNQFATSSGDKTIKVWNLDRVLTELPDPPAEAPETPGVVPTRGLPKLVLDDRFSHDALSLSADGRWMASESLEAAHVWDLSTGQRIWTEDSQDTNSVAISPDGRMLATSHGDEDLALKNKNKKSATVRLWNIERRELLHTLTLATSVAEGVAFSPDGKTLAVGAANIGYQDHANELSLWDVSTGKLKTRLSVKGRMSHVRFSPDGELLAFTGYGNDVSVWDLATNQQRHLFKQVDSARSLTFSPDGKMLVACFGEYGHGRIMFWDVETGKELPFFKDFLEESRAAAFHPEGKLFVTGSMNDKKERAYKFWDFPSGRLLRAIKPERDNWWVDAMVFLPDGKSLVTSGFDQTQIWDVPSVVDPKFQAMVAQLTALKAKLAFQHELLEVDFAYGALTDADLARFPVISQPFRLDLNSIENLTDVGMQQLARQPLLTELVLDGCINVSDAGLEQIAKLPALRVLSCNGMKRITSEGIRHLSGLKNLQTLSLEYTEIKEDALPHLGKLTSLEKLTMVTREVDSQAFSHLSKLTNLRELQIQGRLDDTALVHLGKLSRLERLNLKYCYDLQGTGLAHLAGLGQLQVLEIGGEAFNDEHAALLLPFKQLRRLNLSNTSLSEAGLAHVGKLATLEELQLPERVSDDGLLQLSGLTRLKSLELTRRGVSDRGLAAMKGMTELEKLELHGLSEVRGPGLASLANAKRLVKLNLSTTGVTDEGLAHLKSLTHLRELELPKTITNAGLVHVGTLTNLRKLELDESKVTDAGLEYLKDLRLLEMLSIDDTAITVDGKETFRKGREGSLYIYGP